MQKGAVLAAGESDEVLILAGSDEVLLVHQVDGFAVHCLCQDDCQALGWFLPGGPQPLGFLPLPCCLAQLLQFGGFGGVVLLGKSLGQSLHMSLPHGGCSGTSRIEVAFSLPQLLLHLCLGQFEGIRFVALVHQSLQVLGFDIAIKSFQHHLPHPHRLLLFLPFR